MQVRQRRNTVVDFVTRTHEWTLTDIVLVLAVGAVHHLQQFHLDLSLIEERLLVFDDLDGDMALLFVVVRLHHLTKTALACGPNSVQMRGITVSWWGD